MERINIYFMAAVPALILAFDKFTFIPKLFARKMTHMSMGLLLTLIVYDPYVIYYIELVSVYAIYRCFSNPFRFSKSGDIGIISFNLVALFWTISRYPFTLLKPFFFADPIACLVGKLIPSKRWFRNKTLAGSLAAFIVCLITVEDTANLFGRIMLAAALTLAEAFGGRFDNACIAVIIYLVHIGQQSILT